MSDSVPIFKRGKQYDNEKYELILNGEPIDKKNGSIIYNDRLKLIDDIDLKQDLYNEICSFSIEDLIRNIYHINIEFCLLLDENFEYFYLEEVSIFNGDFYKSIQSESIEFSFVFHIDLVDWDNGWSIKNQLNDFDEFIKDYGAEFTEPKVKPFLHEENIKENDFNHYTVISINCNSPSLLLRDFLDSYIEIFTKAQEKVIEKYQSSLTNYSSIEAKHFDFSGFSSGVRSACERYLIYFSDFLRDVGIKASINIDKKGKDLYFSVIPESEEDELETINILLEQFFIRLPDSDIIKQYKSGSDLDFASERLVRQVEKLEGDIRLINLESKTKDLEIYKKEDEIEDLALTKDNLTDALLDQQSEIKSLSKEVEKKTQKLSAYEVLNSTLQNKIVALETNQPDKENILRYLAVEDFKFGDIKKFNFLEIRAALMARDINAVPKRLFQFIQIIRTWVKSRKKINGK
ncbi:MAG: hypothetical protein AAF579_01910 [Cyanobacteria bacterium P01_C01_bin.118]